MLNFRNFTLKNINITLQKTNLYKSCQYARTIQVFSSKKSFKYFIGYVNYFDGEEKTFTYKVTVIKQIYKKF